VSPVDPENDEITRYIVWHYRYDPDRHERRHQVVAAFDNETEFEACIEAAALDLRRRRESGEAVDPREYVSGVVHKPGERRRQQNARMLTRAWRHGVWLEGAERLELPSNVAFLRESRPGHATVSLPRIRRWFRRHRG
jgi:hypothetical protein